MFVFEGTSNLFRWIFWLIFCSSVYILSKAACSLFQWPWSCLHEFPTMRKLPVHLGIIVDGVLSQARARNLSHVVCCCFSLGIRFVSIYDQEGLLKKELDLFASHLWRDRHEAFRRQLQSAKVFVRSEAGFLNLECFHSRTCKRENSSQSKSTNFFVNIIGLDDSRGSMVEVAQRICEGVAHGDIHIDTITEDVLNEAFSSAAFSKMPDPDLVLNFSSISSFSGFPPWHLRLTEFSHLGGSYRNITQKTLFTALESYALVEQRYGK
mmetsp:Transcript_36814/g.59533  ORF Transcript_36814/g.59533 Transcript_36814/m.59533 type:complete len:266 (+) Transcript_36814:121-918(+)